MSFKGMKKTQEKFKVVVAGKRSWLFKYHLPVGRKEKNSGSSLTDDDRVANRASYLSSCRRRIERLLWANPDLNRFVTLTFKDDIKDYSVAVKEFNLFVKRLRYHSKGKKFKYICVAEFQDKNRDGVVHFHLLVNSYIPMGFLKKTWGNGYVDIRMAKGSMFNRVRYLTKYLSKVYASDRRLWGRRAFIASQNLNVPVSATFDCELEAYSFLESANANSVMLCQNSVVYESAFLGEVSISEFIFESASRKVLASL